MSKFTKLIFTPHRFFADAISKRIEGSKKPSSASPLLLLAAAYRYSFIPFRRRKANDKPLAVVLGFSPWKTFIEDWLPGHEVRRFAINLSATKFRMEVAPLLLSDPKAEVFSWGYKEPPFVIKFCEKHGIPITRVEDGFIRSVALGATKAPPLSLCFDRQRLYFDATGPSDLEDILNSYDFDANPDLAARARAGIDALVASKLSKYNVGAAANIEEIYGPKTRKRILVLGQVEGDMSIVKGCKAGYGNNDLVWIVREENPDAQIIYKPHPEVIRGIRKDPPQSDPRDVIGAAQVLFEDVALADSFETIDEVHTITSLSGFEALMRGIPVTCHGAPFYSGWGLTQDRQPVQRRAKKLTLEQLFAGAYILYPRYYNPHRKQTIEFEEALSLLDLMKKAAIAKEEALRIEKEKQDADAALNGAPGDLHIELLRTMRRLIDTIDQPIPHKSKSTASRKQLPR